MKQSERRTNSVTCNVKSQCAEILIKGEDDADITLKQQEHVASPSPDPVVKVEENDVNLKNDVPRGGSEKSWNEMLIFCTIV